MAIRSTFVLGILCLAAAPAVAFYWNQYASSDGTLATYCEYDMVLTASLCIVQRTGGVYPLEVHFNLIQSGSMVIAASSFNFTAEANTYQFDTPKNISSGSYEVRIFTANATIADTWCYFYEPRNNETIRLELDKAVYFPGDTVKIRLFSFDTFAPSQTLDGSYSVRMMNASNGQTIKEWNNVTTVNGYWGTEQSISWQANAGYWSMTVKKASNTSQVLFQNSFQIIGLESTVSEAPEAKIVFQLYNSWSCNSGNITMKIEIRSIYGINLRGSGTVSFGWPWQVDSLLVKNVVIETEGTIVTVDNQNQQLCYTQLNVSLTPDLTGKLVSTAMSISNYMYANYYQYQSQSIFADGTFFLSFARNHYNGYIHGSNVTINVTTSCVNSNESNTVVLVRGLGDGDDLLVMRECNSTFAQITGTYVITSGENHYENSFYFNQYSALTPIAILENSRVSVGSTATIQLLSNAANSTWFYSIKKQYEDGQRYTAKNGMIRVNELHGTFTFDVTPDMAPGVYVEMALYPWYSWGGSISCENNKFVPNVSFSVDNALEWDTVVLQVKTAPNSLVAIAVSDARLPTNIYLLSRGPWNGWEYGSPWDNWTAVGPFRLEYALSSDIPANDSAITLREPTFWTTRTVGADGITRISMRLPAGPWRATAYSMYENHTFSVTGKFANVNVATRGLQFGVSVPNKVKRNEQFFIRAVVINFSPQASEKVRVVVKISADFEILLAKQRNVVSDEWAIEIPVGYFFQTCSSHSHSEHMVLGHAKTTLAL